LVAACEYRVEMTVRFAFWDYVTGLGPLPAAA
jgi:hypothetical protein